jgi:hypothetical protein
MAVHEIKTALAKLMATENITVLHVPGIPTAMFDVRNRSLSLPVWDNISIDLYDMLVVHEVGHALDTPASGWTITIKTVAQKNFSDPKEATEAEASVKQFLNVIEDARIDKRQKRRYPGSKRNYVAGLLELHDRDFFGVKDRDINSFPFIDRANLYFKGRPDIKFKNDIERDFIKRMSENETFQQVSDLTADVYKYALENKEDTQQQDFDLEKYLSASDGDGDDKILVSADQGKDQKSSQKSFNSRVGGTKEGVGKPISHTVLASEKNAISLVTSSHIIYIYTTVPEINEAALAKIVHDFPRVIKEMYADITSNTPETVENSRKSLAKWRSAEKDTINYMVKEFEMKKSADTYSRISIAKTGVIDTNKLHSYEYNDDIFRRQSTIPKGKNHGFFLVLDWSGSMVIDLVDTMKQLFSLVLFCKKVQIPFEVYLFKSGSSERNSSVFTANGNNPLNFASFTMRNILSSRMNMTTFNRAIECLWWAAHFGISSDGMAGTPLNQAILASESLINKFRQKNKLQIVSAIILTDGDSDTAGITYTRHNGISTEVILRDDKTKKSYSVGDGNKMTSALISVLRDRTGCTALGFYLYSGNHLPHVSLERMSDPKVMAQWKNEKYLSVTTAGYDEYYIINPKSSRMSSSIEATVGDSKMKIAKAFGKFLNGKTVSRSMLNRFITRVASDRFS